MTDSIVQLPPLRSRHWARGVFVCLFLFTGATGLVYEVVWQRQLGHVFGNTAAAATTVLGAYMCGLALGGITIGAHAVRRGWATLRMYAVLECAIAMYALAVPVLLAGVRLLHHAVYPAWSEIPAALTALQFGLAFLVLVVPTTLMGATLPVLSGALSPEVTSRGRRLGLLYGMNTLGAVFGCVLAGFAGIRFLGVHGTLYAAVACNITVGVIAYALSGRVPAQLPVLAADAPTANRTVIRGWALVAFVAGATALAYEVLWVRTLTFYLNNSTYAFSGMLAIFLLGLAIGALLVHRLLDYPRLARVVLIGVQGCVGLWALFALPPVQRIYAAFGEHSTLLNANFWGVPTLVILIKCVVLMGVPTLALGMMWPLVTALAGLAEDVSKRVGQFYAINTFGACLGALGAGFVLLPMFGIHRSLHIVGLVNMGLAVALSLHLLPRRMRLPIVIGAGAAAVAFFTYVPPGGVLRRADETWQELHYAKDAQAASVKVYTRATDGQRVISINGYEVAGTGASLQEIQKALAHYPMLLHPDAETALVIGFGAGGTSYSLTQYPLTRIDAVELVPAVIEASPHLAAVNHLVAFTEPRYHVILDDGRNYVESADRSYDIITVDAIDPKHAGNGHLYALEFYEACRRRLTADGVLVQWLPYHLLTAEEFGLVVRTFQTAFPEGALWFTPYYNYLVLVGSNAPLPVDVAHATAVLARGAAAADARTIGLTDVATWLATFALGPEEIRQLVGAEGPLNTYDHPRIEFFADSNGTSWGTLPFERRQGLPAINVASMPPADRLTFAAALPRALEIGDALCAGRMLHARRRFQEAREQYRAVLRVAPRHAAAQYLSGVLNNEVQEAIRTRLAALDQAPDDVHTLFELGTLYDQLEAHSLAELYYRRTITAAPQDERAYLNLGELLAEQGDTTSAVRLFSKALDINPDSPYACYNLALALHFAGDQPGAVAIANRAQEMVQDGHVQEPRLLAQIQALVHKLRT